MKEWKCWCAGFVVCNNRDRGPSSSAERLSYKSPTVQLSELNAWNGNYRVNVWVGRMTGASNITRSNLFSSDSPNTSCYKGGGERWWSRCTGIYSLKDTQPPSTKCLLQNATCQNVKLLEASECNSQFTAMLTGLRSHQVLEGFRSAYMNFLLVFIFIKLHILVKKEKHSWPSNVCGNSTSLPHLVCGDFYVLVWPRPVSLLPSCPVPAAAPCLLCHHVTSYSSKLARED